MVLRNQLRLVVAPDSTVGQCLAANEAWMAVPHRRSALAMNGLAPGDDAQGLLYNGCSAHALAVVSANDEENGWMVRHINILAAPLLRRGQHGAAAASTRYSSRAAMVANLAPWW